MDTKRDYDSLENVLKKTIIYLSCFDVDPNIGICEFPEPNVERSDTRSVIHTLIFNLSISELKDSEGAKASYARKHGRPGNKGLPCIHGVNCPACIGNSLYIWACLKFQEDAIPLDFEKYSGCGFFHTSEELGLCRAKVYKFLDSFNQNFEDISSIENPIFTALAKCNRFLAKYNGDGYEMKNAYLYKLTNLTKEEQNFPEKRTKTLSMKIFNDKIFSKKTNVTGKISSEIEKKIVYEKIDEIILQFSRNRNISADEAIFVSSNETGIEISDQKIFPSLALLKSSYEKKVLFHTGIVEKKEIKVVANASEATGTKEAAEEEEIRDW